MWPEASVLGLDGAEAGPGEGGDLAGDLVGIELVAELDEPAARTFGEADERMRQRLAVLLVDVDRDQGCDRGGSLSGDLADGVVEFLVASRPGSEQEAEGIMVFGDPAEVGPEAQFGLALAIGGLCGGLGDVAEQSCLRPRRSGPGKGHAWSRNAGTAPVW